MRKILIKIAGQVLSIGVFVGLFLFSLFITYGYRYDFQEKQLVQTGVIDVCIIPNDVELYLDGKFYSDKGCEKMFGINVGSHTVEARKDGYYTWLKKLYSDNEKASMYAQVFLIPLPDFYSSVTLDEKVNKVWVSPDQSKYAVYDNVLNVIRVFSASRVTPYILEAPVKIDDLIWSDNNTIIADSSEGRYEANIYKGDWKLVEQVILYPEKMQNGIIVDGNELCREDNGIKKFITRYSETIESAQYFYNQSNLLIAMKNEIKICDFEGDNCHVIAYKDAGTPVAHPARSKKVVFIKDGDLTQLTINGPAKDAEVLISL
jgi:hypothetical protein